MKVIGELCIFLGVENRGRLHRKKGDGRGPDLNTYGPDTCDKPNRDKKYILVSKCEVIVSTA